MALPHGILIVRTASVSLLCYTAFCNEDFKEPAEKLSSEGLVLPTDI